MKVAILDTNEVYLRRLHDYWSKTYGGNALIVYVFSEPAQMLDLLPREKFDVVLMNPSMEVDVEEIPGRTLKVYLLPGKKDGEINGIPALARNGNADELYSRLTALYEAHMNIDRQMLPGKLVLFTSADGGCGTSSCAVGYGKYLALRGRKVLYLNLEIVSALELMVDGDGQKSMEELFYLCETNRKNLNYSMENLVSTDSSGLNYIVPCRNPLELFGKSSRDISQMLTTVIEKGAYDVVIADRGLNLDDIATTLIQLADSVVLTATADGRGRKKLERTMLLLEEMNRRGTPINSKLKVLFNRSAGGTAEGLNVLGSFPEWTGCDIKKITDRMSQCAEYQDVLTE